MGPAKRKLGFGTPARASPAKKAKISTGGGKRKRKQGGSKGLGKALINLAEQKRYTVGWTETGMKGSTSGTGTWYGPVNILAGIVTGSTAQTRNGDETFLNSIDIKVTWLRPLDRPNTVFRIALIRTDYDGIPSLGALGAGPPMRCSLVNSNVMASFDEEKMIIEKEWYANPVDVGNEPSANATIGGGQIYDIKYVRIPVNRKIHYKDATKTSGVNCYSIIVTGQDERGGAGNDIGECYLEYSLYFKDV